MAELNSSGTRLNIIDAFAAKVIGRGLRVVLPEGRDSRILLAAREIRRRNIAEPIILGTHEQIETAATEAGVSLDGIKTLDPKDSPHLDAYTARYMQGRDNVSPGIARRMVAKALFHGGMMVACDDAHAMVAGAATATATVIQAGALTVGFAPGIETVSSYFLMIVPQFGDERDKAFIFADCAVNIDPSADQLADIALASAQSAAGLLAEPPRVALLSYSTRGSAEGPSVEKVRQALRIVRSRRPDLAVDGELQADAAVVPRVAQKKVKDASEVAGRANVLIFPDLDAGNIAYKLTQYMAGARAIGPFLQGFAKPLADLSRGASIEDIVTTAIITLAQVKEPGSGEGRQG
ncbi:MAG TPA: phosphate acetyltransferase [Sedimentisphaerales bacterium]|nr:phosphate acetyltransferase [Sedimentisphaerales bacterium]HRS12920.1 phosphate acetyltransferase [Sedimentisphaerales bacterium]HRV49532.1 phosphate acetyltransferase [Sedimentisphaerales bacterium]